MRANIAGLYSAHSFTLMTKWMDGPRRSECSVVARRPSSDRIADALRVQLVESAHGLCLPWLRFKKALFRKVAMNRPQTGRQHSRVELPGLGIVAWIGRIAAQNRAIVGRFSKACFHPIPLQQFFVIVRFGQVAQCISHRRRGMAKEVAGGVLFSQSIVRCRWVAGQRKALARTHQEQPLPRLRHAVV